MDILPIFPLNTVLYPSVPLPLHIFEPRYRKMIRDTAAQQHQTFGLVCIRRGEEALGPLPEPCPVGCSARLLRIDHLEDGRMNIDTIGERRFRILKLYNDQPYLTAHIEWLPFPALETDRLAVTKPLVRQLILAYLVAYGAPDQKEIMALLERSSGTEPAALIFRAAALIDLPNLEKQRLLEISSSTDFTDELIRLYRRELKLMAVMGREPKERLSGSSRLN